MEEDAGDDEEVLELEQRVEEIKASPSLSAADREEDLEMENKALEEDAGKFDLPLEWMKKRF